jgi:pyridoxine 5-phosphate synthase
MLLGINIDHIAVLREARKINDPDPLEAIEIVKKAGANQITIHLREDRRHINDIDVKNIINFSKLPINLECAIDENIIDIVCNLKPHRATIVPEKREEITTEGGLNVEKYFNQLEKIVKKLHNNEIAVSLFIEPNEETVRLSKKLNVDMVEFHSGKYANIYAMLNSNLSKTQHSIKELELSRKELIKLLKKSFKDLKINSRLAKKLNLHIAVGHGLNYQNIENICKIKEIEELNIGQSIIARSIFVGLEKAILNMKELIKC